MISTPTPDRQACGTPLGRYIGCPGWSRCSRSSNGATTIPPPVGRTARDPPTWQALRWSPSHIRGRVLPPSMAPAPPLGTPSGSSTVSSAKYLVVRNVTGADYPYVAHGYDTCAEGDVAVDLEPAAAAQGRRLGREPLLEVGQQPVIV